MNTLKDFTNNLTMLSVGFAVVNGIFFLAGLPCPTFEETAACALVVAVLFTVIDDKAVS